MNKLVNYSLSGKSEKLYTFNIHSLSDKMEHICAVYIIVRRDVRGDGGCVYKSIYVGETENLNDWHDQNNRNACFLSHGANCIGFLKENDPETRLFIAKDIRNNGDDWCCNGIV